MSDRIFVPDLLDGRAALVTGGGSGIGRGIAGRLLAHGADVCIASRGLENLEATADELEAAHGGRVLPLRLDVREPETVGEAVDRAGAVGTRGGVRRTPAARADATPGPSPRAPSPWAAWARPRTSGGW